MQKTTSRGSMHVCVSLLESTRARRGHGHACMHACMQSGGKTGTKEILKHACLGCPGVPKRPLVMKACPHRPALTSPAARLISVIGNLRQHRIRSGLLHCVINLHGLSQVPHACTSGSIAPTVQHPANEIILGHMQNTI